MGFDQNHARHHRYAALNCKSMLLWENVAGLRDRFSLFATVSFIPTCVATPLRVEEVALQRFVFNLTCRYRNMISIFYYIGTHLVLDTSPQVES